MSRYSESTRYDSDDGYSVATSRSRRPQRRPQGRYRSPSTSSYDSEDSYTSVDTYATRRTYRENKNDDSGKATLVAGLLAVVAGALTLWTAKKAGERERKERARREQDFARRKADRRRDEERFDDQRRQYRSGSPDVETRRIGYTPAQLEDTGERRKRVKRIEAPPRASSKAGSAVSRRERRDDGDYRDDRRSRRG